MVKKTAAKSAPSVGRQLTSFERLVRRGFQQTPQRFGQIDKRMDRLDHRVAGIAIEMRASKREMNDRFTRMEESISHRANHGDGFMELHETVDIEMRVMKERMKRFEDRLAHLEAAQVS